MPFFSMIDAGRGRLAEVLAEGLGPGAAEDFFGRSGILELAERDRNLEIISSRLLGLREVDPALPRGTDLDGLIGRTLGLLRGVSGRADGFGAAGLVGRVLRMSRFEFEAGRRMPEELLGLEADGRLTRVEAPREDLRLAGAFEVRTVPVGRPVKRGDVA